MKFLAVFVAILAVTSAGQQWTIHELSEAIQNPNTDPAMIPLLEDALNQMMAIIWAGGHIEAISVGSPVDVLPVNPIGVNPINPTPVNPINPTPVVNPVQPESAAPLVQIIVNVQKQQQEVQPEIVDEIIGPAVMPVIPRPEPVPAPIIPEPVVLPAPVAPEVVLPEPVILPAPVAPEVVVNPIDVIAISAPEVNPVDLINPVPVVSPVGASESVGPIV